MLDYGWLIYLVTLLGVIIRLLCCVGLRVVYFGFRVICFVCLCDLLLYFVFRFMLLAAWLICFIVVGFYLGFACGCWCFVVRLV